MRIWWCQEHECSEQVQEDQEGDRHCVHWSAEVWSEQTYGPIDPLNPCRMVPMRLIPDNEETVETVRWCEEHGSTGFPDEPICVWHRMVREQGVYAICRMVDADLIVRETP